MTTKSTANANPLANRRSHLLGLGLGLIAAVSLAIGGQAATGPDSVMGTDFTVEPPTLISLGFEWRIVGDGNRNASVAIAYRQPSTGAWKDGLPLHRLQNEHVGNGSAARAFMSWTAPNMFAGSIFDLEPNTAYEVRLTLSDPDGVNGEKVQLVTVRTRPEPMASTDGRVFHVYPFEHTGPKQEPSYTGLMAAYFTSSSNVDSYRDGTPRVRPGDVLLVHAGLYKPANRLEYGSAGCCHTSLHGTYFLTGKGTAERPIAIKAAGDGDVIFDGDGNDNLFNMMGSTYNYFEGITFRNTEIAILAGHKDITGTVGLTVKHSKFEDVGEGIFTDWQGSKNFYVVDNVFQGKNAAFDSSRFNQGFRGVVARSQYAIKFYGSGHVFAYNRIRDFHDGIDHASFGPPNPLDLPVSNDIYNNDIANLHDDCVEADGASFNMRILRNHCVNVNDGFSSQPTFGGPVYVIRNVVYEPPIGNSGAIKTIDSQGWTIYNNTFATDMRTINAIGTVVGGYDSASHFRNNLFLAQNPIRPAFEMATLTRYSTSDYNGFMGGAKAPSMFDFLWPFPGTTIEYDRAKLQRFQSKTLEEFKQATGREMHSITVDYTVFRNLKPGDVNTPTKMYDPATLDFALNPTGPAIDAGVALPNITEGFAGKAPDLGAYELGQPIPHYGPRPRR